MLRGKVDRSKIEADVAKLTAYYRSFGFFKARIGRELYGEGGAAAGLSEGDLAVVLEPLGSIRSTTRR